MRSNVFRKLVYLPLLALALMPASAAVSLNTEAEASGLLKEVQSLSRQLKNDAGTLESYKWQTTLGWQTHAHQLTQTREHINAIGKRLDRLQAIRSATAPWQQRAIDGIVPVAANVAAHTQSAIEHLNGNRTYVYAPVYADHLTSIWARSGELKESVDMFLEFGETADKVDLLQQKLDLLQGRIGLLES